MLLYIRKNGKKDMYVLYIPNKKEKNENKKMIKMRHRFLSLLFFAAAALHSLAQQTDKALIVEMKSGEKVAFTFANNPQIRFVDDNLVINTNLYEFSYAAAAVQRYVFGASVTGINAPVADGNIIEGDDLTLNLLKSGSDVTVFSTDGKVVLAGKANSQGVAQLSLKNLPVGVYVVKTDSFTTKILKR